MRFRAMWLVLVLVLMAGPAAAAPITYSVFDSIGVVSVSGSLTTDGTLGSLTIANFTDFSLTVSNSNTGQSDVFTPLNAFISPSNYLPVIATATTLGFGATGSFVIFNPPPGDGGFIVWRIGPNQTHQMQDPLATPTFIATGSGPSFANAAFATATQTQAVPEPASMMLLGLGLAGLGARRLRQRHK